jgi:phosphomannomutase/phosphomannomutase/phosphoglucomutase
MSENIKCFKAYDIRGRMPEELNEEIAYKTGLAFSNYFSPQKVILGMDMRLSSPMLLKALAEGITDGGADVYDIGLCGTEEVYFSTFFYEMHGGIMVTASHNPADYNGMKLVRENSKPISGDSGLHNLRALIENNQLKKSENKGKIHKLFHKEEYIRHILGFVDLKNLSPLKIVVNPGNGTAGDIIERLAKRLPVKFIKINFEPDGTFPNGIPNPLLPENRKATMNAVLKNNADLGIAWDGDFDRCFLFDEKGNFIEGYYLVGLLAEAFLSKQKGIKIIHDPRLTWNTIDIVSKNGGMPVMSKTGHAFIKERMRLEDAIYGGEMSSHHYFKDFAYCDSGMIPWLLAAEIMSLKNKKLSQLIEERMKLFPVSGEINRKVRDIQEAIEKIKLNYQEQSNNVDYTDGISMDMGNWRFNLRGSNTEPLLRLNVESRGNTGLMKEKTEEILNLIGEFCV